MIATAGPRAAHRGPAGEINPVAPSTSKRFAIAQVAWADESNLERPAAWARRALRRPRHRRVDEPRSLFGPLTLLDDGGWCSRSHVSLRRSRWLHGADRGDGR